MDATDEVKKEITYYLQKGSNPRLCDCLDMVPSANLDALYNMICHMQANRVQKTIIAFHVTEDVSKLIEGKPEEAEFSKEFLNTEEPTQ